MKENINNLQRRKEVRKTLVDKNVSGEQHRGARKSAQERARLSPSRGSRHPESARRGRRDPGRCRRFRRAGAGSQRPDARIHLRAGRQCRRLRRLPVLRHLHQQRQILRLGVLSDRGQPRRLCGPRSERHRAGDQGRLPGEDASRRLCADCLRQSAAVAGDRTARRCQYGTGFRHPHGRRRRDRNGRQSRGPCRAIRSKAS